MEIRLNADGLWYHGSDKIFSELNEDIIDANLWIDVKIIALWNKNEYEEFLNS